MDKDLDQDRKVLKELISSAVKGAIVEMREAGEMCNRCCQYCELTPQQHCEHHQMFHNIGLEEVYKNHRSVIRIREIFKAIEDNAIRGLVIACLGGIITAVWYYVIFKIGK